SILSVSAVSAVFLSLLKYIFLPQYRLELNRKKHSDDETAVLKYYTETYKANRTNPKSKFELQKATNAAFGTTRFNYELIFMLFDRDERDVESIAKEIQKRWILIKLDYAQKKINARLTVKQANWLAFGFATLYAVISIMILVMAAGYYWIPLKNFNQNTIMLISLLIVFICAYAFYALG
ncbi:hypothetical protein, partial [Acinetobacter oleivorans]|uniref:hypothetical protein n=1 Tax=Acinetobacter oleivorans TaxID=1148157 RepID=UPI0015801980